MKIRLRIAMSGFFIFTLCHASEAAPSPNDLVPASPADAASQPGVHTWRALFYAQAVYEKNMNGPGAADGGPIKELGPGIDRAEKLVRHHSTDGSVDPELLTPASREFLKTERGQEWLADGARLKAETWFPEIVDAYFVDDVVATMVVVYARKPLDRPKTVRTVQLIRSDGEWRVSLDLKAEAVAAGAEYKAAWEKLHAVIEARRKEFIALVTRPLIGPLPLDGFYMVPFQQSHVLLAFTARGEVTIHTPRDGSSHTETCEYQVLGDDVIIEGRLGPLRMKIDHDRSWTKNGRTFYALLLPNARHLFPEAPAETYYLKPQTKQERAINRPELSVEAATPASTEEPKAN